MNDCQPEWFDPAWWTREIDAAVRTADPVLSNLRITLAHYHLGLALRAVTGADAGREFPRLGHLGLQESRSDDSTGGRACRPRVRRCRVGRRRDCGELGRCPFPQVRRKSTFFGCGVVIGLGPPLALRARLVMTAREVLAGNRTVLEDIGTATGRFVASFHDRPRSEPDRLARFLGTLRPGTTETGGQDLLKRAFGHYHHARYERVPVAKHESMLLANCCAILHEHIRLQPYIRAAVPRLIRCWATDRLLSFSLGAESLGVAADVPLWNGESFPASLRALADAELLAFLSGPDGWDRTPDALAGSAAVDWTALPDRMNYIVDLFRSRHLAANLFASPFTTNQIASIAAGHVPLGPL